MVVAAGSLVAAPAGIAGANPKPTPSPSRHHPRRRRRPLTRSPIWARSGGGYTEGLAINDNYTIQYAKAINDKGQIVADAYTPTYQTHTLLLTPN